MTEEQKNAICGVILAHKYAPGDYIVNEGDDASSFYVIKEVLTQIYEIFLIFSHFTRILLIK